MNPSLHGIVPPLVTPLSARDVLDIDGLERLIEHVLAGGVHGMFLLGTTGEGPSLSYRLRRELIDRACRIGRGRVPVLVGVTDTAFEESVALASHAADCGATAVVASTPYYFPVGQPELVNYFEALVRESPLPLCLYNMPVMTKTVIEPETVDRLMQQPRVIGIKDSSGDLAYFGRLLALARGRSDWAVMIGAEELTSEAVQNGAQGGVSGGANLRPRLYVDDYDAAVAGDLGRAAGLNAEVRRIASHLYTVDRSSGAFIKGLKCALSLIGLCDDELAPPLRRFGPVERAIVRERLVELGLQPVA